MLVILIGKIAHAVSSSASPLSPKTGIKLACFSYVQHITLRVCILFLFVFHLEAHLVNRPLFGRLLVHRDLLDTSGSL
jgi:hypothetical protein